MDTSKILLKSLKRIREAAQFPPITPQVYEHCLDVIENFSSEYRNLFETQDPFEYREIPVLKVKSSLMGTKISKSFFNLFCNKCYDSLNTEQKRRLIEALRVSSRFIRSSLVKKFVDDALKQLKSKKK